MSADFTIIFTDPANISTELTGRIDGLQALNITYNDELKKSFTSELEFYDDGYNILKSWLLPPATNAIVNAVKVKIYDNCCNTLIFEGVIKAATIDWCEPICSIKANIIEDKEAFDCLKATIIWDDHNGFLDREQIKLRYSVDLSPTGLLIILLVFYSLFAVILGAVQAIYGILLGIAYLLSFGSFDFESTFQSATQWVDDLQERMLIVEWYHPTALVRDYIKNVCDKCSLTFQSSILNNPASPYYNTLLFAAQVRKGYKPSQTTGKLISQNLPVETLDTLMETYLKPLFNANYWVIGGALIFERKDHFDNIVNVWIDAEQLLNDGLIQNNRICFSYLDRDLPAFADFHYTQDFNDPVGNYGNQRFDKVVEWNLPYSPIQKGSYAPNLASSPARVRGDKIENDTYDNISSNPGLGFIDIIFGGNISNSIGMLLLGDHVCANYKFLIWDGDSENGKIQGNYSDSFCGGVFQDFRIDDDTGNIVPYDVPQDRRFNYPFTFRPDLDFNLYDYHKIENPRYGGIKLYNFDFTFNFSCTQYINFDFTKTVRLFKNGQIVYGKVTELNINFVNRTISVKGEV